MRFCKAKVIVIDNSRIELIKLK